MAVNAGETNVWCYLSGCKWTPDALRRAYESIVGAWTDAGVEPNRLAARAPGVGKGWKTFKHRRKKLERTKFEGVESICLSYLSPGRVDPDKDWLTYAVVWTNSGSLTMRWLPAVIGGPSRAFLDLFQELAEITKATYGRRDISRLRYPHITEFNKQPRDWTMNLRGPKPAGPTLLLPNVYDFNHLSDAHLEAPMGRTAMTLREWIEDDPEGRGTLRPFTTLLTEWAPPEQNIPEIREALFRAGRLFYWRFFNPSNRRKDAPPVLVTGLADQSWQEPEPYYRPNIDEPWEATDPIPEIFRADFYRAHLAEQERPRRGER